ncbi:Uncharacterized protein HZ326_5041 [Fusarium oxysporum f. sp. albedinis]|nr:Uncharacterized protein HZ326_5041 [Fusarium oxysporum f. sp. albedinis]
MCQDSFPEYQPRCYTWQWQLSMPNDPRLSYTSRRPTKLTSPQHWFISYYVATLCGTYIPIRSRVSADMDTA